MRERLQDIRADRRLARAPPHHGKQVRQLPEVVDLVQLPDRRSHRHNRLPSASDPPWTTSTTTIAATKARAMLLTASSCPKVKKNAANPNRPSRRPRTTATAGA